MIEKKYKLTDETIIYSDNVLIRIEILKDSRAYEDSELMKESMRGL